MTASKRFSTLIFYLIALFLLATPPSFAASGITYQGRLLDPSGVPVTSNTVQFRLQIRTPGTEDCLLYEEMQTLDLSMTSGVFAISVGDGSGTRSDAHASDWNLFESLSNRQTFSFSSSECSAGNSYVPSPTDNRRFRVFFNLGSGWEALPVQTINYIPLSIETYAVGGFPASALLRVEDSGNLVNTSPLSNIQYTELLKLINGTSTTFEKSGELNGSALPAIGSGESVRWNGTSWESYAPLESGSETDPLVQDFAKTTNPLPNCLSGQVLSADGTSLSCVTDTSGTLPDVGTAGTYTKVTTDDKGRVTSGTTLDEADLPTITTAGKVSGGAITSGEISGSTSIDTSGNIVTTGNMTANGDGSTSGVIYGAALQTRRLHIYDDDTNFVTLKTPSNLSGDYALTLPVDAGTSGQVLSTDGSGGLSWISPSTGSVTSVTGTSPIVITGTASAPVVTLSNSDVAAATYGSATQVPVFEVDEKGLIQSVTNTTISGVSPVGSTLSTGKAWMGDGTGKATEAYINVGDLKKSDGTNQIPTTCSASQTLTWSSLTDVFTCTDIEIEVAQISDFPDLDATYFKQGGNSFSTTATLGTTDSQPLRFITDNSPRMTIDGSGFVGIGTSTPNAPLDVFSDGGGGSVIKVQRTNNAFKANVGLIPAGTISSSNSSWIFGMDSNSNDFRISSWDGSDTIIALSASNTGNVGIGTTSPSTELTVSSTKTTAVRGVTSFNVSSGGWAGQFSGLSARGTLASPTYPQSGDSLATYAAGGRNGSSDYRSGYLLFSADSNHTSSNYETSALLRLTDSGDTTAQTVMSWKPSGKVGIGTEEPSTALEVVGTIKASSFEGPLTSTSTSLGNGSASSPSMTFSNDSNTGFYLSGTDSIGVAANGVKVWDITTSAIVSPTTGGASISSASGTAAAPTFSFSGDEDTGWYLAAPDTLAASTGSAERIRIDSSGNVGIGTSSPTTLLDVAGNFTLGRSKHDSGVATNQGVIFTSGDDLVLVPAKDTTGFVKIKDENSSSNISFYSSSSGHIQATGTSGTPTTLTVNASGGRVGVGTTNPSGILEVLTPDNTNNLVLSRTGYTNKFKLRVSTDGTTEDLLIGPVSNDKALTVNSYGNVGIGTSTPSALLQVNGGALLGQSNASPTAADHVIIQSDGDVPYEGGLLFINNNSLTTGAGIKFSQAYSSSGSPQLTIGTVSLADPNTITTQYLHLAGGKIGIGTTEPDSLLHLRGASPVLNLQNTATPAGNGGVLRFGHDQLSNQTPIGEIRGYLTNGNGTGRAGDLTFHTSNAGTLSEKMRITATGKIGIGTTDPEATVHIIGPDNDGTTGGLIIDSGTQRMTIDGNEIDSVTSAGLNLNYNSSDNVNIALGGGNVGIGTNNPQAKLEVSGGAVIGTGVGAKTIGVVSYFTSTSSTNYIHIKTPFRPAVNSEMYHFKVEGYSYSDALDIDLTFVGYCYANAPTVITSPNSRDPSGTFSPTQYIGSDGYIYLRFKPANTYYVSFRVDSMYVGNGRIVYPGEMSVISSASPNL